MCYVYKCPYTLTNIHCIYEYTVYNIIIGTKKNVRNIIIYWIMDSKIGKTCTSHDNARHARLYRGIILYYILLYTRTGLKIYYTRLDL